MTITAFYAAILAIVFVLLSVRVINARQSSSVALGDGGDRALLRRQRAHANFAEYVPLALILLALAEMQNASAIILHAIGLSLLIGRVVHAYNISRQDETIKVRVAGMALTFIALVGGALINLWKVVVAWSAV